MSGGCREHVRTVGSCHRSGRSCRSIRHSSALMKIDTRSGLLAGYVSGPEAATQATVMALTRAAGARAVVLVEGLRRAGVSGAP